MMINFKDLREQLVDEKIKEILSQFNVEPYDEDDEKIIFPTCCHNLDGGSPKLYYYKKNKMFRCYTECQCSFDIFDLLIKMYHLRGQDISIFQAVELCDLNINSFDEDENNSADKIQNKNLLRYMQRINSVLYSDDNDNLNITTYDKKVLKQYSFDYVGLMPWIDENIGIEALQRFNIKYDAFHQGIVIPNFDYDGNLIGIRERYLKQEDITKGKYRPLYNNGTLYRHPTGYTLYGIYENHKNIERKHTVIIYEGEKSVLKHETIYGKENNIALATLGQNISKNHIEQLRKMGVRNVILAYDTDYEDYKQLAEVEKRYCNLAKILTPYFNVSILVDYDFELPYKSSPIDGGKEIFEHILQNRRIVK